MKRLLFLLLLPVFVRPHRNVVAHGERVQQNWHNSHVAACDLPAALVADEICACTVNFCVRTHRLLMNISCFMPDRAPLRACARLLATRWRNVCYLQDVRGSQGLCIFSTGWASSNRTT